MSKADDTVSIASSDLADSELLRDALEDVSENE